MRTARIRAEGTGIYHCVSRVIQRQALLEPVEKETFRTQMRQMEGFSGVQILTYAVLSDHFHLLVRVGRPESVSDRELARRVRLVYGEGRARELRRTLGRLRESGDAEEAERARAVYTCRMFDLAEFMKALKQRFTQWYNRTHGRRGTLWEQRFKSVLVEDHPSVLRPMAAYIDLNPVRAGLVSDPKDYPFCGYGEAMAGVPIARRGLATVVADAAPEGNWRRVARAYRQTLFDRGPRAPDGLRVTREQVDAALAGESELSLGELLRCQVRYFTDGLVLGSESFVEEMFEAHRDEFGLKRKTGARAMRYGAWDGLCTMRDLRKTVIRPTHPEPDSRAARPPR